MVDFFLGLDLYFIKSATYFMEPPSNNNVKCHTYLIGFDATNYVNNSYIWFCFVSTLGSLVYCFQEKKIFLPENFQVIN